MCGLLFIVLILFIALQVSYIWVAAVYKRGLKIKIIITTNSNILLSILGLTMPKT